MPQMTPASWLALLEARLDAQIAEIELPERYYAGNHRLAFVTKKFRSAFGNLFQTLSDNWCRTVVDAANERLRIDGFRIGGSRDADQDAWAIWQANNLDAASAMLHTEAIKDGRAYILVAPPHHGSEYARITVEHPSQMIVACEAGNRRHRLAALKRWRDYDGYDWAVLYLPDRIIWWRSKEVARVGTPRNWVQDEQRSGANPAGVVPVFPVENNPTMLGGGQSDLTPVIPMQDVINKLWADLLVASEYTAHPQRYATGVEIPLVDGEPDPNFEIKTAMTRLLVSEDKDASFGQLDGADLKAYIDPIREALNHLAAQSRTPPHYLLGNIVNASGDALKAAETGLTARVRRKIVDFSEPWEDAMRLAFKLQGKTEQAAALDAETIWADPEYRSQGELIDSLVKQVAIGVPNEILWEKAGYTPQEIQRMRAQQDADAFLSQSLQETVPPQNGAGSVEQMAEAMRRAGIGPQP